jgi:putative salt-induced outer membrane protein YdiY
MYLFVKWILSFFILSAASAANAFINIEEIRLQNNQGISGSTNLQLSGQSGNTQKLVTDLTTLNLYREDKWEYILLGKYRYGESQHIKDTHEGNLHARITRVASDVLSHEGFAQTEFSQFKQLKRRDIVGGGERIKIFRNDNISLYVGTGGFYEHRLFNRIPWSEETIRGNFYLANAYKIEKGPTFSVTVYYQPSFKDLGDYRVQLDSGITVPMIKKINLIVDFNLQKDSRPAEGVKSTDLTYLTGFSWSY